MSVTAASNDLTGNGPAPLQLLEQNRSAVFTHPDRTDNDLAHRDHPWAATLVSTHGVRCGRLLSSHSRRHIQRGRCRYRKTMRRFFDAINNLSTTRGRAAGVTAQVTRTKPLLA